MARTVTLYTYWAMLDSAERKAYAQRAGTTVDHLRMNVMGGNGPRKVPTLRSIYRLALASEGYVSLDKAVQHFKHLALQQAHNR